MIDLKHLRTLLALRKTGNLTKAAEMLCLTQSALSQQIRLLESDYGMLSPPQDIACWNWPIQSFPLLKKQNVI